ncbi:MAG: hypothetical protein AVDCRST_MAG13-2571, partial [uncultured Solirubrobacteraceae bacterium]
ARPARAIIHPRGRLGRPGSPHRRTPPRPDRRRGGCCARSGLRAVAGPRPLRRSRPRIPVRRL